MLMTNTNVTQINTLQFAQTRSILMYRELKSFFENISEIPYAVVKGEALSLLAYGNTGMRESADIDILVSRSNLDFIVKELNKACFVQELSSSRIERIVTLSSSHQMLPFYKKKKGLTFSVDVNFDIFWGEYDGIRVDIDEYLKDRELLNIYGQNVYSLTPCNALIQLVLHHYKDMNSIFLLYTRGFPDKRKFKDVYMLIINNKNAIDAAGFTDKCKEMRVDAYVYCVLYYTNYYFPDLAIEDYLDKLLSKEAMTLLESFGLCCSERKKWPICFDDRITCCDVRSIIEPILNSKDFEKIQINRKVFHEYDSSRDKQ